MKASDNLLSWQLLLHIAQDGTLTDAARTLNLPLSKASRLLSALEAVAGAALLDRTVKPAQLTPQARSMLPDAALLTSAFKRLTSRSGIQASAAIQLSLPANATLLPLLDVLNRFEKEHHTQIDVINDCGVEGLLAGKADLAWFGFTPDAGFGLVTRRIGTRCSFLMASPAYLKRSGTPQTPEDLFHHTLLLRQKENGAHEETLVNGSRIFTIDNRFQRRLESAALCRARLLAGEGIAIDLTTGFMMQELAAGDIVPVLPGWHRRPWPLVLAAHPNQAQRPVIAALSETIARHVRHLSGMADWKFWYRHFNLPLPAI